MDIVLSLKLFFLVILQNASFTLVSRARNSNSYKYHALAAVGSNGIWYLVFREISLHIDVWQQGIIYVIAAVSGSVLMHWVAMTFFEKPKKKVATLTEDEVNYVKGAYSNQVSYDLAIKTTHQAKEEFKKEWNKHSSKKPVVLGTDKFMWIETKGKDNPEVEFEPIRVMGEDVKALVSIPDKQDEAHFGETPKLFKAAVDDQGNVGKID